MAGKGRRVLYLVTADAIRSQITSGKLAAGEQVGPSLEALAAEHHVGQATVRSALAVLRDEGLVETIPGKGTFVLAGRAGDPEAEGSQDTLAAEVAELRDDVSELQASVMEIYTRMSWDHPAQQQADGKAGHEHVG